MTFVMSFGRKLRMMRARAGLSQAELAKRAGISRWYIGLLEADRLIPLDDWVASLKQALNWTEESEKALEILVAEAEEELT